MFNVDSFTPFVEDFIALLTRFLVETDTWESRNKLIKALNMTIERSGDHVSIVFSFDLVLFDIL